MQQLFSIVLLYFRNSKYFYFIQAGLVMYLLFSQEANHYQVLGVTDMKNLRPQFYKKSLQLHPDKSNDFDGYLAVKQAYEVLKNENTKLEYDISIVGHYPSIHQMIQSQLTSILYYNITLALLLFFGSNSVLFLMFNFVVEVYLTTHHDIQLYWRTPAQIINFLRGCYFLTFTTYVPPELTISNVDYWVSKHFTNMHQLVTRKMNPASKLKQSCIKLSHEKDIVERFGQKTVSERKND